MTQSSKEHASGVQSLRALKLAIKHAEDVSVKRRLTAVLGLIKGVRWGIIHARTGLARSTAYAYLKEYRLLGLDGLSKANRLGRRSHIPEIVRERFDYLCRIDPQSRDTIAYIIERETMVFAILDAAYKPRQINRWYKQLALALGVQNRVHKVRKINQGYELLRSREFIFLEELVKADDSDLYKFQAVVLEEPAVQLRYLIADALYYALYRDRRDRELLRYFTATRLGISVEEVAFRDEPNFITAQVPCDVTPEMLNPKDIFEPLNGKHYLNGTEFLPPRFEISEDNTPLTESGCDNNQSGIKSDAIVFKWVRGI